MKIEILTVGPIDVNCHILYCERHKAAIIVDPGDSNRRIIDFLNSHELTPKLIVNTHGHPDHTGGVAALTAHYEIPFLCHKDDEWMMEDEGMIQMAHYYGLKPAPKNDAAVADGEIIDLCDDFKIQVIHTPGHTPGGICLLANGNHLLTGDTLFQNSIGRSDLAGGNHDQLLRSIRQKLLVLPNEVIVYPGHGETSTIGHEKQHNPFLRQTEGFA